MLFSQFIWSFLCPHCLLKVEDSFSMTFSLTFKNQIFCFKILISVPTTNRIYVADYRFTANFRVLDPHFRQKLSKSCWKISFLSVCGLRIMSLKPLLVLYQIHLQESSSYCHSFYSLDLHPANVSFHCQYYIFCAWLDVILLRLHLAEIQWSTWCSMLNITLVLYCLVVLFSYLCAFLYSPGEPETSLALSSF